MLVARNDDAKSGLHRVEGEGCDDYWENKKRKWAGEEGTGLHEVWIGVHGLIVRQGGEIIGKKLEFAGWLVRELASSRLPTLRKSAEDGA